MIKAIIFDCFGVVYVDCFAELYKHFGGDIEKDKEFIEEVMFKVSKGLIPSSINPIALHLGIDGHDWESASEQKSSFNKELLNYTKELRKKYKVSMLSNIGKNGLRSCMDYSVLEEYFDDIVESAKIGYAKPEPRAYEIATNRLGVRLDECIFVDDRQNYVDGARHVGMKAILYTDFKNFKKQLSKLLE